MRYLFIIFFSFTSFSIEENGSFSLKDKVNNIEKKIFKRNMKIEGFERSINKKHEKYLQHVRVNKKLKILLDEYIQSQSNEKLILSKRIRAIKSKMIKISMLDNNQLAIENKIIAKILSGNLRKDLNDLEQVNTRIHSIESKISSLESRINTFDDESIKISEKLRLMGLEKQKLTKNKDELFLAKNILEDEYLELKANQEFEKIKDQSEQEFVSRTHLSNPIDQFHSAQKLHRGLEFRVSENSSIKVIDDGEVVHSDVLSTFGRIIIVKHKNNLRSVYLGDYESNISKNAKVKKSQKLGNVLPGSESKVYFELRKKEKALELANFYHLNSII